MAVVLKGCLILRESTSKTMTKEEPDTDCENVTPELGVGETRPFEGAFLSDLDDE